MSDKTDHWMPLLIGNYLRDTQHLDAERHGCYLLWLMHYWTKGPLPNVVEDLVLIGKLHGPNAPSIAQRLLMQFFTLEADGLYHQKRADLEKARAGSLYERNQKGGRARAEKAKRGGGGKFVSGDSQPSQPTIQPVAQPASQPNLKQAGDMAGPVLDGRWTSLNAQIPVHPEISDKNDQPNGVLASLNPATPPAERQPIDQPRTSTTPTPTHIATAALSPSLKEKEKEKEKLFSPAAGFSKPEPSELSLRDQAHMIGVEVARELKISSHFAIDDLIQQAKLVLEESVNGKPATMDYVREGMVSRWKLYRECKRLHKVERPYIGFQSFFGLGIWRDSTEWKFKKGETIDGVVLRPNS